MLEDHTSLDPERGVCLSERKGMKTRTVSDGMTKQKRCACVSGHAEQERQILRGLSTYIACGRHPGAE